MSHIHLPDGFLSLPIWGSAFVITLLLLAFSIKKVQKKDFRRLLPFTGVSAAVMLLGMSVPIFIVPVHLSLAVLTGIILGPSMGFIVAFVVMTILAMFGHGGLSLIGLNTLLMGIEMFIGYHVFHFNPFKNVFVKSSIAVVAALLISMSSMVVIVGNAVGYGAALPHSHTEEADHSDEGETAEDHAEESESDHEHEHEEESFSDVLSEMSYLSTSGLTALILILMFGMALESVATGILIKYFSKVRPEILTKRG